MKKEILETLSYSDKLIISPDMDGFMTAALISRFNGSTVVGAYDKNILVLADGINPEECLFVDCDLNRFNLVSIGNHMRLQDDNMSNRSFNPNTHFGITKYSDKFPFATAFLISLATEIPTSPSDHKRMAFADSTLKNMENYSDNMRNWSTRMMHPAVSYIMDATDVETVYDDELRVTYPNQSFVSKRYGKERYIQTLNDALISEGIKHLPITHGKKYMADKVGINTVKRYLPDIISYAEVFGGEYSVTYDQEVEWK